MIATNADDDIVHGGKGNDIVRGRKGSDRIFGDLGSDSVTGGEGNDIFVLSGDADFFTDFTPNEDLMGLDGLNFSDLNISQCTGENANNTVILT